MTATIESTVSTKTLAEFLAGDFECLPTVVRLAGADAVVLARSGGDTIEVYYEGALASFIDRTPAPEITDRARRERAINQALVDLGRLRRESQDELQRQHAAHEDVLDRVREYAIEKHREGSICQDGLNEFLRMFDLPEYSPRVRVSYVIRGSYEVDSSASDIREDAEEHLGVDLADIDAVIDGSEDSRIDELAVEPVTD
jgi:hypothetical protein